MWKQQDVTFVIYLNVNILPPHKLLLLVKALYIIRIYYVFLTSFFVFYRVKYCRLLCEINFDSGWRPREDILLILIVLQKNRTKRTDHFVRNSIFCYFFRFLCNILACLCV